MSLNTIGDAVFFTMTGPLEAAAQQVEVEARAGIDGNAVWQTGLRGEPVEVTTTIDLVGDLSTAQNVMNFYRAMKGGGPFPVIRADQYLGLVIVLDVKSGGAELMVSALGGVNGGNVMLSAKWSLLPVG